MMPALRLGFAVKMMPGAGDFHGEVGVGIDNGENAWHRSSLMRLPDLGDPTLPTTVIAEQIGWGRSIRVLGAGGRAVSASGKRASADRR